MQDQMICGSMLHFNYRLKPLVCVYESALLNTLLVLTSELQDLRIMNEAADRKLTEVRNEAKEYRSNKDKEVAQFETEV